MSSLMSVRAAACVLVLVEAGCGGASNPLPVTATCASDAAPPPEDVALDVPQPADVAAVVDVAVPEDVAPAPDAPDGTADVQRPRDAVYPDLWVNLDGLADGPVPPGILFGSTTARPGVSVSVDLGLRNELLVSMGLWSVKDITIADAIHVAGGYGVDLVYMKVGSIIPPWNLRPAPGLPFIVSFGGARVFTDDPTLPPHPEYAPARALYDAMTNVPQTFEDGKPTRVSPGGRVKCQLQVTFEGAGCFFTGVQRMHIF
jgi:hypothetical protein